MVEGTAVLTRRAPSGAPKVRILLFPSHNRGCGLTARHLRRKQEYEGSNPSTSIRRGVFQQQDSGFQVRRRRCESFRPCASFRARRLMAGSQVFILTARVRFPPRLFVKERRLVVEHRFLKPDEEGFESLRSYSGVVAQRPSTCFLSREMWVQLPPAPFGMESRSRFGARRTTRPAPVVDGFGRCYRRGTSRRRTPVRALLSIPNGVFDPRGPGKSSHEGESGNW